MRPTAFTLPACLFTTLLAMAPTLPADEVPTAAALDAELALLERPQTAERLATYARNLYDALVQRGFGHEEAVRIVTAFGVPGRGGRRH